MNSHIITLLIGIIVIFSIFAYLILKLVNRLTEVNKQLMILVAGKESKPGALQALVASNKPPQKEFRGVAVKKDNKKLANTDYTMKIGVQ